METEAADFSVDITTGPHMVIAPAGDLDLAAAGMFVEAVNAAFTETLASVILDLAAVRFLDSSGLGALLTLHSRCQTESVGLRTINAPKQARRVLELTRLTERFNLIEE
jgi:anti-sigma B factor antagonist